MSTVRALTVEPGRAGSAAVVELDGPPGEGEVVVDAIALGICGTDREIVGGEYGTPPPGERRLVLGHESVGRVTEAPGSSAFTPGDLVVGIVRRPDPVPCKACAAGYWDCCLNGRYTEHGIKERHGFGATQWRAPADALVRIDADLGDRAVLVEPTSVVAKAWDQVEHVGRRGFWDPETVLVTGAGPIGLLAALLGVQRGLDVHVLDRAESGPKPDLVRRLGATYHTGPVAEACPGADVVIECTGVATVVLDAITVNGRNGLVCLTGLSGGARNVTIDGNALNRGLVLENDAVVGSVNANRRHYGLAVDALRGADPSWLDALITRRVAFDDWPSALESRDEDVKVVLDLSR